MGEIQTKFHYVSKQCDNLSKLNAGVYVLSDFPNSNIAQFCIFACYIGVEQYGSWYLRQAQPIPRIIGRVFGTIMVGLHQRPADAASEKDIVAGYPGVEPGTSNAETRISTVQPHNLVCKNGLVSILYRYIKYSTYL